jgi:hypothetical protein
MFSSGMVRRFTLLVALILVSQSGCDCEGKVREARKASVDRKVAERPQPSVTEQQRRESEPNDSPERATPIGLAQELRPIHAEIESADDVDWFVIEPAEGARGLYELTIEPRDEGLDVALYLEAPGHEQLPPMLYDLEGPGKSESIPILEVDSKPVRFFVTGKGGSRGAYVVDLRRRLSAGAVAAEPNDYPEVATALSVPGEIQGFYDRPGDRDVFFVAPAHLKEGVYSLEVGAVPGLSQHVRVYDRASLERPILQLTVSPRQGATIPNIALGGAPQGLWFVLESADENFDRQRGYRLRLIEHPAPGGGYRLEQEPNDTAEAAQAASLGEVVRGYLHEPSDVDRFRVELAAAPAAAQEVASRPEAPSDRREEDRDDGALGQTRPAVDYWEAVPLKQPHRHVVQVRLTPLSQRHQIGLRWITDSATSGRHQDLTPLRAGQPLVFCNHVVEAGSFDVEVRSVQMDEQQPAQGYDYELAFDDIASQQGLEVEPNDELVQADRLVTGEERIGYISLEGDRDFYAFVVPAVDDGPEDEEGQRRVKIVLRGNSLNLGFQLLDDEGGLVADVNRTGAGADEELAMDLPRGLYYVAIAATRGSSCEPYRLSLEFGD